MATMVAVENLGPVVQAQIPIPEGGGVVVLKARNGAGKSRTLSAVENLITGRGKPDVRDGALSGSVTGFGATLRVARSARRTGELEVTSLDGKLSVADLVDPGLKSPESADAKRIKALISVAEVEPSAELFYELFGGRDAMESVVSTAAVECDDLVAMADKIKRDAEAAARKAESDAEFQEGRARGAREAAADVNVKDEHDAEKLSAALEHAIAIKSKVEEQVQAHTKAADSAELARHRLEKARGEYNGPTLEQAKLDEDGLRTAETMHASEVADLEAKLVHARNELTSIRNRLGAAITARKQAELHEQTIETWREQIEVSIPPKPSDESVAEASEKVRLAREAMERGAVIRAALEKHKEAEQHASTALAHRKRSVQLRNIAAGTDEVLSKVVAKAGTPLRVEAGRLVLDTGRGATYFAELSHGERWKIALDVAIKAVGKGGLIVLQQEAWEGLDPIARTTIVDHVKGSEVVILTAECSADESVKAEVLN